MKPHDFYFKQYLCDFYNERNKKAKVLFCLLGGIFLLTWSAGESLAGWLFLLTCLIFWLGRWKDNIPEGKEYWEVLISNSELIWRSPTSLIGKTNDISFHIKLDDINEIQQSYSDFHESAPFRFIMKDGAYIQPTTDCSIVMKSLIQELQNQSISFKRVSNFR